jgi:hypothetical protein
MNYIQSVKGVNIYGGIEERRKHTQKLGIKDQFSSLRKDDQ